MKPDFEKMVAEEMAAIGMKHDGPLANLLATAYSRVWDSAFNAGLERAAEIAENGLGRTVTSIAAAIRVEKDQQ